MSILPSSTIDDSAAARIGVSGYDACTPSLPLPVALVHVKPGRSLDFGVNGPESWMWEPGILFLLDQPVGKADFEIALDLRGFSGSWE